MLNNLLATSRLGRMVAMSNRYDNAYNIDEYFNDLKKGIFSEIPARSRIENRRRNLQKSYVERLISLVNPTTTTSINLPGLTLSFGPDVKKSDISSVARANLNQLRTELVSAAPAIADNLSRYHVQDLAERIRQALNPR